MLRNDDLSGKMTLVIALIINLTPMVADASETTGDKPLSFHYQVAGPVQARPVQVFSDGEQMFIEFKDGVKPKSIMIKDANGASRVIAEDMNPYYRIPGDPENVMVTTEQPDLTESFRRAGSKPKMLHSQIVIKRTKVMAEIAPPAPVIVVDPAEEKAKEIQAKLTMFEDELQRASKNIPEPEFEPVYPVGVAGEQPTAVVASSGQGQANQLSVEQSSQTAQASVAPAEVPVEIKLPDVVPVWEVRKGETLNQLLKRWVQAGNWSDVYWEEGVDDYVLMASASYEGEFSGAIKWLTRSLNNIPVVIETHEENHLVRVKNPGDK
jgi:hypothetical protein